MRFPRDKVEQVNLWQKSIFGCEETNLSGSEFEKIETRKS